MAVGLENILVPCGLPHLRNHHTFHRNKVEDVTVAIVAAKREIPPGKKGGDHRRLYETVFDFASRERQEAVFNGWESNRIHNIAHVQWVPTVGIDP